MGWEDRIREGAYTSPGGTRIVFKYTDVRREWDKKTIGFQFPDANGTYVQDTGRTGRRFPLRCYFVGPDCDEQAEAFESLLGERGAGILEHPVYGTVDVVPYGTISRLDNLVTAANQAIIEATFWETIGTVYPSSQADPRATVLASIEQFNADAAEQFVSDAGLDSAAEQATLRDRYLRAVDSAAETLRDVADAQDSVRREFDQITAAIETGIDVLIAQPLDLAFQTVLMVQAPARAEGSISARLSAYRGLADAIINDQSARTRSEFQSDDLMAQAAVSGAVLSVVNNEFASRVDAIEAADAILNQFDALVAWRDIGYNEQGQIDTGAGYRALQDAVSLAAGYLVEISFSLATEKSLITDRARTIIDLAYELYGGQVDDHLDFLIESNNLTGSEILEIPVGRRIVYYE